LIRCHHLDDAGLGAPSRGAQPKNLEFKAPSSTPIRLKIISKVACFRAQQRSDNERRNAAPIGDRRSARLLPNAARPCRERLSLGPVFRPVAAFFVGLIGVVSNRDGSGTR
jgi:hypothetical protein